jgi:hypothetical protein
MNAIQPQSTTDVAIRPAAAPLTAGSSAARERDWPLLLFIAALPVALAAYLLTGWSLPLWLDETFTGTIASQPTFKALIGWCLSELTGPVFYVPMWLWVKLAGPGDAALRLPLLALALATPVLIAWRGHRDRDVRLFWAALTALWLPMVPMATEARPYALLILLCTLQALAFLAVARRPTLRHAFGWSIACSLALLTHYYAASTVLFQAIALAAIHRRGLLRLYPAALPFLLAGVWVAFHLRFLVTFATGHVAHYSPIPPLVLLATPTFVFGPGLHGFAVLAALAFTRSHWWNGAKAASPEALLVWTALAAFALILFAGLFRATFQIRYLVPVIPALLFGIACWASGLRSAGRPAPVLLAFAALFAAMLASPWTAAQDYRFVYRRDFQFETASKWLGERKVERLHFLWSTPTGEQSTSGGLAEVAGFFLRRDGKRPQVVVSRLTKDPNAALLAAAGDDPDAALLWISDVPLPVGVTPAIDRRDPRWQCRSFGSERYLVYACRRKAATI